jgi:arsenate reductase-like glutaredoxin family protein
MAEKLRSKEVEGNRNGREITLYGLMVCEPCREAELFLQEHGYKHTHVILEHQQPGIRQDLKRRFQEAYGARPIYPVLEIDGELVFGFDPETWQSLLDQ